MINETLKGLMKLVQPNKEEEPMTNGVFGVPMPNLSTHGNTSNLVTTTLYPTQYTQGLAAQNAVVNYPMTGIFGGAVGGAVNAVHGQAYTTNYQTNAVGYNSYTLPPMSGVLVALGFIDANGIASVMMIDQAYMQILQDISGNLQMTYGNQRATPYADVPQPHLKMLEGDFSEEEMTEAEGIIAELEGKSGEAQPPSHP